MSKRAYFSGPRPLNEISREVKNTILGLPGQPDERVLFFNALPDVNEICLLQTYFLFCFKKIILKTASCTCDFSIQSLMRDLKFLPRFACYKKRAVKLERVHLLMIQCLSSFIEWT